MHRARVGTAAAIIVVAYLWPYFRFGSLWWRFALSTIVILGVGAWADASDFKRLFGIAIEKGDFAKSVLVFALVLPVCFLVATELVPSDSLRAQTSFAPRWLFNQFFQALNDELVLRAVVLTIALRRFGHSKRVVVILSILFALGHSAAYGLDGVRISATALISLFAFAVIANALFVRFRHIGYGFALHYAWNLSRFNTDYYVDGRLLSEGETFNYVEGNASVAVGAVVAMFIVAGVLARSSRRNLSDRIS